MSLGLTIVQPPRPGAIVAGGFDDILIVTLDEDSRAATSTHRHPLDKMTLHVSIVVPNDRAAGYSLQVVTTQEKAIKREMAVITNI